MSKRIVFRKTNLLENISKKRLFLGILAGLLFSFAFYAFMVSLRESFRVVFSLVLQLDYLLILDTTEVNFYNFIYAVFSSILGLSITLKIILEKPKQFKSKTFYYRKKHSIFVDLSVINSYFLNGIFKFTFIIAFFFSNIYNYYFSFYPEYNYLLYLLLIVMFLEQWKTIRLVFKNKALKWMLISLVSILIYSFTISKIDIIDYKTINNSFLKHQLNYKYELDLPKVKNYKKIERLRLIREFNIAYPKGKIDYNAFPIIIYQNEEYALEEISEVLSTIKNQYNKIEYPWITIKLNVDKHIKMRHISLIKQKLSANSFLKIAYGVIEKKSDLPKELQFDISMPEKLSKTTGVTSLPLPLRPIYTKENVHIIFIDNNTNTLNIFEIEEFLRHSQRKIIHLNLSNDASLDDYIQVKDALLSIYLKLRNEYAVRTYNKQFHQLNYEQIRNIKLHIYPMIILLDNK